MFKEYILLAILSLFSGIQASGMTDSSESLDAVKAKWSKWGDSLVTAERDAFLSLYGLDAGCLEDDKLARAFKDNSDKKIIRTIACMDPKPADPSTEAVKKIAAEIFKKCRNIEIVNAPGFDIDGIGAFSHYENGTCYVALNCEDHLANIPQLEELLRHEYSHVMHEDNFNEELLQYMAWANSNAERDEIEKQTLPYHKAFETRADVYAAANSPFHGAYLLDFLKSLPETDEVPTHPKTADRITLLETIKLELNLAKAK